MESLLTTYGLTVAATLLFLWRWLRPSQHQLPHIPAVGSTIPILSIWGAVDFLLHGPKVINSGYRKYKGRPFKVAQFRSWFVVISGQKLVDDLRLASDDELSLQHAMDEQWAIKDALGPNMAFNYYHVKVIRTQLTKGLQELFPDIREELIAACNDKIPDSTEWTAVPAFEMVMHIVARTTSRIFVGPPFCNNADFLDLMTRFTVDFAIAAQITNLFPQVLKPFVSRYLTKVPSLVQDTVRHLGPEIERRLHNVEQYGHDYPEKPLDLLSWLIDNAEGEEMSVRNLCVRILLSNFAAIHTSTMTITVALYILASSSDYSVALREEIEAVIDEQGWSKNALGDMHKLDSFLKECQRYYPIISVGMRRVALKDFTFSDGTSVPKGTHIAAAFLPPQHDPDSYDDPDVFKPWRFSDARERENDSVRHALTSPNSDYLIFGIGRHACPGRFFAANEMKMLMAHLVMTYDIKMENSSGELPYSTIGDALIPDNKAKVLCRKRQS